jgi:hypothetical protein
MILDPVLDLFRGKAITIPPLDGALRPNTALDDAPVVAALPAPDNLALLDGRPVCSSGPRVLALDGTPLADFPAEITALAVAPDGTLAVATDDGRLSEAGADTPLPNGVACVTALAYAPDGTLWLANGSARHPASLWVADLMQKGATGSVWRRPPGGAFEQVAANLAWPAGLLPDATGAIVSEAWRHRLLRLGDGAPKPVLAHLPGYPGRLAPTDDGGAWLAVFAPRNRLIELVLDEDRYRADLLATVPRAFWIAPALASGASFLEPLQCGAISNMANHSARSPSRSPLLAIRLDAAFAPTASLHSRANGRRHGITSLLAHAGRLLVASKGGDAILELAP